MPTIARELQLTQASLEELGIFQDVRQGVSRHFEVPSGAEAALQAMILGPGTPAHSPTDLALGLDWGKNRLGHITRQGPPTVRKLLVEAAWQGIRRSPIIRAYFERMQHGDPERRKIATVATAHYMLRAMYTMLLRGEGWRSAAFRDTRDSMAQETGGSQVTAAST